ncbi:MAG TPA: hypothetical protein PKX91_03605 [Clostridia bacterium]|jgi:hypothetical protein|nr:hypothetical protein [Clostridia bacterium]
MLREDFPRPKFIRPRWKSLDGKWQFCATPDSDFNTSTCNYDLSINIPDALINSDDIYSQRALSDAVTYSKDIKLSQAEVVGTTKICINSVIGDVKIYINGNLAAQRKGIVGNISINISDFVVVGKNQITLFVVRDPLFAPSVIRHPRIAGSVWLEFSAKSYFENIVTRAATPNSSFYITGHIINVQDDMRVQVDVTTPEGKVLNFAYDGKETLNIRIPIPSPVTLWKVLDGKIYYFKVTLKNSKGGICDTFHTYAAFRDLAISGTNVFVNSEPIFFRHVTDHYSPSIHEANLDILKQHLATVVALGFNGIVADGFMPSPQYLYLADRLGLTINAPLLPDGLYSYSEDASKVIQACITNQIVNNLGIPSLTLWHSYSNFNPGAEFTSYLLNICKQFDPSIILVASPGDPIPNLIMNMRLAFSTKEDAFKEISHHLKLSQTLNVPLYYSSISMGDLIGAYTSKSADEKQFIDTYEFVLGLLMTKNAAGFSYISMMDSDEHNGGILDSNGEFKLSNSALASIKEANVRRSMAELTPILNKINADKETPKP